MKKLVLVLTALALTACEPTELFSNSQFDAWCGDKPCGWEVDGEVARVGTWHPNDYAVELVSDDARIHQLSPIERSFTGCLAFSMLAKVDPDDHRVVSPSVYSEMVWEARKARFARDRGRLDWIVMRNRLGAAEARNKRDVGATLEVLAKRIGFRTVRGFGERVIFRELYLQGLTLMDPGIPFTVSLPATLFNHPARGQLDRSTLMRISGKIRISL